MVNLEKRIGQLPNHKSLAIEHNSRDTRWNKSQNGMSYLQLLNVILCFLVSLGNFTSVAKPTAWRNLTTYQVKSTCHHSRPCLAEYSKAWWLLCQPSPNASNATHLHKFKIQVQEKFSEQILDKELDCVITNCSGTNLQCSMLAFPIHDKLNLPARWCDIPIQSSHPTMVKF